MAAKRRNNTKSVAVRSGSTKTKLGSTSRTMYDENRANFPAAELQKHDGQWVAFSADGRRIVASAPDLDVLEDRLAARGEDPEQLTFERIDSGQSSFLGGAELL